ncbi:transcriptional regulator MarR family [Clostridium pasteurianum DSM 525 = ATCC 6013]|jgi:DNA-binding MarR family transcriptional regulator|uniref:Transcriptional regulator MarR family n=1 Tax=Clostridium pasteurianum DSM 525 = ATCC 6013 TaxID=1262449 RepID=A0A0H3J6L0_CLOPA|nr:MarR family winged helix-turn-helix transcriptional regulator [Clostridium pasteurianum]AJA49084.1 transcriptional regulator MarR family [Clostridium pasteurianum DSM 525 = ATCC 6013]AJA53072.1 transcriptional regulator MarR family [Clostridium pasteurianum DSM 525 = ATCC 6013]AOZ76285.1 MarR family transcriptional regulator [Clostridium pasteurianum DSM 525 = ATCC 6013]AOZ80081.1 MarR family transcriptional regulator [Clostridium pasteurianum]ELP59021.1 MarR family transcriptional regulato
MDTQSSIKKLGVCACKNLRMTSRVLTQYFDKALQSAGLRATQFSLLANISYRCSSTVGDLAGALLMDQTTVTRNVEILRKKGLIDVTIGEDDSRKRYIKITELGIAKLMEAIPSWEKAQQHIENGIGKERYKEFLDILSKIQSIV